MGIPHLPTPHEAFDPVDSPTLIASFDVQAFARASDRAAVEAEADVDDGAEEVTYFDDDEPPTLKRIAVPDAAGPASRTEPAPRPAESEEPADLDRVVLLAVHEEELDVVALGAIGAYLICRLGVGATVRELLEDGAYPLPELMRALDELARRGVVRFV